ncbi:CHASE2 domain-containing protein [Thermodesulfobacteriota bacterium]
MKLKKTIPDWLIGIVITLLFLVVFNTDTLDFTYPVEMKSFDMRARLSAPGERSPDIELVTITDDDLIEMGRWPWSRSVIAKCIDNLSEAGAKVIALNIYFSEPEENTGLKAIKRLKEEYDRLGLAQKANNGLAFYQKMSQAESDLDNDTKLYNSIKNAGNVAFQVFFDTSSGGRDEEPPAFVTRHAFKNIKGKDDDTSINDVYWPQKITPLLPLFAEAVAGIGHNNLFPDSDGYIRKQIHAIGYLNDIYLPSYAVTIVKLFKGLSDDDVILSLGEINGRRIDMKVTPTSFIRVPLVEYEMGTLINWKKGPGIAFHQTPFAKVYKKETQMDVFKNKIVIIGHVAQGIADERVTPVSGQMPGVEILANTVDNILNQKFFSRPGWAPALEFGALIIFGLFISFALPRLKAGVGALTTLGIFLAYGAGGSALFFTHNIWIKVSPPLMLLVIGYILVISKRFLITERTKDKVEADSVETNKMLGLSFQQQGMLDLALEKFRRIPLNEEGAKELLYTLGLDFERKRQFSKALSTYYLIVDDGDYKDLKDRIPKLKGAESTMIFGAAGGSHPGDIGATISGMDTKPTLGRYEIIDELGRGAMGIVFKGEDPKIHRTVAIKTVRLSEFDETMLDDMKERFFREAESAGLLTHPNIVTIYDAGEEHDLAFIAMEYLEGHDLEDHTSPDNLLPVRETLSIVAQVADALDFANSKGIVHRDIKPANIMRVDETGEVKVTDFGIARITASSKTKTGVILGTPSYMSPEQVAGKKVDGRSDIFSLGVVLFEMLCGLKPFEGEDMTSLMYKIAREQHPPVKSINPRVPAVIDKIIDRALAKEAEKRYQTAGQMAEHLNLVIKKIDEARAKK